MSKSVAIRYQNVFVDDLGLAAEVDHDGDVIVRRGELTLVVDVYGNDPAYLRLLLPAFYRVDADETHLVEARSWAERITARTKVAKVSVADNGSVTASVEMLVAAPGRKPSRAHLVDLLPRSIDLLLVAAHRFAVQAELDGIRRVSG